MLSRGRELISRGDGDWLISRVDKWVAQCQGYSRLRSRLLSRGCQTMMDRPSPHRRVWSRSDSELLNDLIPASTAVPDTNVNISTLSLEETPNDNDNDTNCTLDEDSNSLSLGEKQLQYDRDIADYIAYLNRPVINMNDHYIEIHQYHYEPSNFSFQNQEVPIRPPTRRKKHKIDLKKTQIVDRRGVSPVKTSEYSEFLVRRSPDENRNINIINSRSSDEENKDPIESLDRHRPLAQKEKNAEKKVDTVINKEGLIKVKRGQTFSTSMKTIESRNSEPARKSFLSFRTAKRNKSGRRKKRVVVGEAGIEGPIWPAVLLTFDRSISPGPPDSPDESEV